MLACMMAAFKVRSRVWERVYESCSKLSVEMKLSSFVIATPRSSNLNPNAWLCLQSWRITIWMLDETDWSHILCQNCIGVRPVWSLVTKQDRWSRWASKCAPGRIMCAGKGLVPRLALRVSLISLSTEDEGCIRSAESERIGHYVIEGCSHGFVTYQPEMTRVVYLTHVRRRRSDLISQRENGKPCLKASGRTQQMTRHRLGRADQQMLCVVAKGIGDCLRLGPVPKLSGCGVGIQVLDCRGGEPSIGQREFHDPANSSPILRGSICGKGVGIRHITHKPCEYFGSPVPNVLA